MEISEADNFTVLKVVSDASGRQSDWVNVAAMISSSIAPEKIGLWRHKAMLGGYLEYYENKMNVARITDAGRAALSAYEEGARP
jgi:hypothetical protein